MQNKKVAEVCNHVGEQVLLAGWLYNLRRSGKIAFLILRDGSGFIQCIAVKSAVGDELYETIKHLTQESSIIVTGMVRAEQRASGGHELDVTNVEVVQRIPEADPYPITPKEHGIDFLMDNRHLWLRSKRQHAVMRVRHEIVDAIRDYLNTHGFTLVDAPIFTASVCEGTTTLFEADYFGDTAYLSQSGQLYNEAAAMSFGKVYSFGPVFIAEKSKTRRHLTEFWMVEPEMAYATLKDAQRVAEDMLVYVVGRVLEVRHEELKRLERETVKLKAVSSPFLQMTYDDAVKLLEAKGSETRWGGDFSGADETVLTEDSGLPLVVDFHPASLKPFHYQPNLESPGVVLSTSILAPEGYGEILSGGERIYDADLLLQAINSRKLPEEALAWYLDLRKYGSVPHAGFKMGLERLVAWICGLEHVRETAAFPRMMYRLRP